MLEAITLFGSQPNNVVGYPLPLANGIVGLGVNINDSPIQIKKIDGLGPEKADIVTSQYAVLDGERFSSSSVSKRNIVLTIGFNPNWSTQTMDSLRVEAYKYFMPRQDIRMQFKDSLLPDVQIDGFIESNEPNIFSQDPEMQVSIVCPYPYFRAVDSTILTGPTVSGHTYVTTDYPGSIDTGFDFQVFSSASLSTYTGFVALTVANPDLVATPYPATQELRVNDITINGAKSYQTITIPGEKAIRNVAIPTGAITNLLSSKTPSSIWPKIRPGINQVQVNQDPAVGVGQDWSLEYYALFGGL